MDLEFALTVGNVFAALLILVAFLLYNRESDKINTGTWAILAFGDSLEFGSYFEMTQHDLLKNVIPFCFAVGSILTFFYALWKRRFSFPDATDIFVVLLDVAIMVAWLYFGVMTSTGANLAYQATSILAFVPMYRGLANGNEKEKIAPWALWTMVYILFYLTYSFSDSKWEEGVYPLVGLITHALVLCFALQMRIDIQKKSM